MAILCNVYSACLIYNNRMINKTIGLYFIHLSDEKRVCHLCSKALSQIRLTF